MRGRAISSLQVLGFRGILSTAFWKTATYYIIETDMGVPRHHMAKGKQLRRRSHLALKKQNLMACPQCKKAIRPHVVCKFCGYYKGREAVNVVAKQMKKAQKRKEQQAK